MLDHTAKTQQLCDTLAWWIKCKEFTKCNPQFVALEFLGLSEIMNECEVWAHKARQCRLQLLTVRGVQAWSIEEDTPLEKTHWCIVESSLQNLLDHKVYIRTTTYHWSYLWSPQVTGIYHCKWRVFFSCVNDPSVLTLMRRSAYSIKNAEEQI